MHRRDELKNVAIHRPIKEFNHHDYEGSKNGNFEVFIPMKKSIEA